MPGAFDKELMFRTTGAMTVGASYGPLTIYGTPLRGMAARIVIPADVLIQAADTALPSIYASDDASTYYKVASREGSAVIGAGGGKEWILPFHTNMKYVKLEILLTVASTVLTTVWEAGLILLSKPWTRA